MTRVRGLCTFSAICARKMTGIHHLPRRLGFDFAAAAWASDRKPRLDAIACSAICDMADETCHAHACDKLQYRALTAEMKEQQNAAGCASLQHLSVFAMGLLTSEGSTSPCGSTRPSRR